MTRRTAGTRRAAFVLGLMLVALAALALAPLGEARAVLDEGGDYGISPTPAFPRASSKPVSSPTIPIVAS